MEIETRLLRIERRPREVRVPGPRLSGVRRLVVAREDKLGDFVLALPAVERIAATYPDAELALVVDERVAPLARVVPGVTRVVACSASAQFWSLRPDTLLEGVFDEVAGITSILKRTAGAGQVLYL